jgi:hypothetical protein
MRRPRQAAAAARREATHSSDEAFLRQVLAADGQLRTATHFARRSRTPTAMLPSAKSIALEERPHRKNRGVAAVRPTYRGCCRCISRTTRGGRPNLRCCRHFRHRCRAGTCDLASRRRCRRYQNRASREWKVPKGRQGRDLLGLQEKPSRRRSAGIRAYLFQAHGVDTLAPSFGVP